MWCRRNSHLKTVTREKGKKTKPQVRPTSINCGLLRHQNKQASSKTIQTIIVIVLDLLPQDLVPAKVQLQKYGNRFSSLKPFHRNPSAKTSNEGGGRRRRAQRTQASRSRCRIRSHLRSPEQFLRVKRFACPSSSPRRRSGIFWAER